jgi:energy-coupling factor transporter ATP-binding protein EcfA2
VYIHRISLRNLRGFDQLDFDLARPDGTYAGWTVFTGDNGSGKSTLLKAIAVCLTGKDTARALQPSFHRWIRQDSHAEESFVEMEVFRCPEDDELADSGAKPTGPFPAKISLKNGGKETTLDASVPEGKTKKYATPTRTIWAPDAKGWFSCGYGPFRRVFGASPEAMQQMVAPTTARYATMFQEAASLAQADHWLRDLKYKELEDRSEEAEQLKVLLDLLQDELMPNQLSIARVDSDGLWLRDRNGVELAWREMSDGYRAALALLTDIFRHLVAAYGIRDLTDKNHQGKTVVKRSGVVLIDEIDAHLHPEWQREIGFWLKTHFPRIQFLVTTHSPIICQAADPNGLFVLPEPGSGKPARALTEPEYRTIIASRPDTILRTPAFGLENTRSPRAVEGRRELARLAGKKRAGGRFTSEEKDHYQELDLLFGSDEEES